MKRALPAAFIAALALATGCNPLDPFRVIDDEQRIASVTITPDSIDAIVGDTVRFSLAVLGGKQTVISGRVTTWSVGNPIVAAVSDSGLATARAVGRSEILATVDQYRVVAVMIVKAPPPPPPPAP